MCILAFPREDRRDYLVTRFSFLNQPREWWTGSGWTPDKEQALKVGAKQAYKLTDQWTEEERKKEKPEWNYSPEYLW